LFWAWVAASPNVSSLTNAPPCRPGASAAHRAHAAGGGLHLAPVRLLRGGGGPAGRPFSGNSPASAVTPLLLFNTALLTPAVWCPLLRVLSNTVHPRLDPRYGALPQQRRGQHAGLRGVPGLEAGLDADPAEPRVPPAATRLPPWKPVFAAQARSCRRRHM